MKKILIAILLLVPSIAFAGSDLKISPQHKPEGPWHIGDPIKINDPPWHIGDPIKINDPPIHWGDGVEHPIRLPDHPKPLCSCIGNIHIPLKEIRHGWSAK
jgi:hypothetical protein